MRLHLFRARPTLLHTTDSSSATNAGTPLRVPAHSCEFCQPIIVHVPYESTVDNLDSGHKTNIANFSGAYAHTASASCLFFQWAIAPLQKEHGSKPHDESWTLNLTLSGWLPDRYQDYPLLTLVWSDGNQVVPSSVQHLSIHAEPDNAAAKFMRHQVGRLSVSSEATFHQLRKWISTCNDSHRTCQRHSEQFMPSAVIEIISNRTTSEPNLRVVRNPPCRDYIALSYCWGEGQTVKATRDKIDDLARNINYRDLPRTLQDAVTVTSELGCRFLWVDVLCIVQDDEVHTAKEVALMSKIYENAYTTIVAARSWSCDQGFLHDIVFPTPSSHVFRFSFRYCGSTSGSILCSTEQQPYGPIETRAWTLQEYLLSRRIIRFGEYQVTWLCTHWCSWNPSRNRRA